MQPEPALRVIGDLKHFAKDFVPEWRRELAKDLEISEARRVQLTRLGSRRGLAALEAEELSLRDLASKSRMKYSDKASTWIYGQRGRGTTLSVRGQERVRAASALHARGVPGPMNYNHLRWERGALRRVAMNTVRGVSLPFLAVEGALLAYEHRHTPPVRLSPREWERIGGNFYMREPRGSGALPPDPNHSSLVRRFANAQ